MKTQEEKIVELMRNIKKKSPHNFYRLLGTMEGINAINNQPQSKNVRSNNA